MNRAWEHVLGYKPEELLGKPFVEFLHPDDRESTLAEVERQLKGKKLVKGFINRYRCKDGSYKHLEWVAIPAKSVEAEELLYAAARDVSDRVRMEAELRESEERYRNLFDNKHTVMLVIDPENGDIIDANPAAELFYGWSTDILKTMNIKEINTLSEDQVQEEMQNASLENRKHFQFRHRQASGETKDVEVYSGPIFLEGRQLLYSIVIDITERVRTERELDEKMQQLERFNEFAVGRELQMLRMKDEVNGLLEKLGQKKKYSAPDQARQAGGRNGFQETEGGEK